MADLDRRQKRELLLSRRREEIALHDIYLNNPEVKLAWYKKYSKEEFFAYLLTLFFMLAVAFTIIYFFRIGYFEPKVVERKEIEVEVQNIITRGETIVRVFHEDTSNEAKKNLEERIEKTLLSPNNNPNQTKEAAPPDISATLSANMVIHLDPLSRPFDLHVDSFTNPCREVLIEPGQKIKVAQETYYRQYDKTYYYDFVPVEPVCIHKKG